MSSRFTLTSQDWYSIKKGAFVALIGAIIVFLSDTVVQLDWGAYTPFVVAFVSIIVNILRKWLAEQK